MRLTKRTVCALQPGERDFTVWDDELRGFGCRVHPSGRLTFVLKYRVGGGRAASQRKMVLGTYGTLTVDQARELARHAQADVVKGGDPAGTRAAHRRAETLQQFAERYLADHAQAKKSKTSAREDRRLLEKHILPKLGARKVIDLTTADISKTVQTAAQQPSRRRQDRGRLVPTPVLANRVRALLSKMLSLAKIWGLRSDPVNPASFVEKYREKSRERYLSNHEVRKLGDVLLELESNAQEPWQAIAALRLLLFTGCRKSEILSLRWDYIDYDNKAMFLPESKTGRKTIYLNAPVLEILAPLPRKDGNPWVLPNRFGHPNRHFNGLGHIWERVRKKAGLHQVRLHDLRHTYASKGVGLGVGLPIIGGLLGHALPTTTAKYAHLASDPVRDAGERIAARLKSDLSEVSPRATAEIVPLVGPGEAKRTAQT